jgi:mannan endo-1,4-beta-mannosidase
VLAKILAALAMPVIVVTLVVAVLRLTHHTAVPPLKLPATPSARAADVSRSRAATPGEIHACEGHLPRRFSGIAVQNSPAQTLDGYHRKFGTKPQIVEFYNAFRQPFRAGEAWQAVDEGQVPFIQLNPRGVIVKQIANGAWNRHLRNYATALKAFPCKVILSFGHEMNGWWYSWGHRPAPESSTSPAEFIAAWKHIHDVFANNGVSNVIWSWDPSHQYGEAAPGKVATAAKAWYPGSDYVDWIGLDGYLGYDRNGHAQNFKEIFGYQLQNIRSFAPGKPVYLAETGVATGPAVASQVAELFAGVKANHLSGLVWFDANSKKHDYRLGFHVLVDAAYRKNLAGFVEK